ncbi:MAG: phage terminase small subunit P27 family [Methylococcaceae bacterium]|nr:phage terminase small subunit P27 family [Methylococcaceae bacterium]
MGRKMLPTKVKQLKGTAQKCRINKSEPEPEVCKPTAPDFLDVVALKEWNRIIDEMYKVGTMTACDVGVLAAYCLSWSNMIQAKKQLEAQSTKENPGGLLAITTNGNLIQNPLVGIYNTSARDLVKCSAELGLSPASRGRVSSNNKVGKSQW